MSGGRVRAIDPCREPAWEDFVAWHPGATVFHTPHWARALTAAYGFQPVYYVLETAQGEITAALPLMLVRSRITGHRLVGLPFSDLCPALAQDADEMAALAAAVQHEARRRGLEYVELRGGEPDRLVPLGFVTVASLFVRHVMEVPSDLTELERRVHESARRGVRKALRSGVKVRRAGPEAMPLFYRLYEATRRRQRLLPAPRRFFAAVGEHLLGRGLGTLLLAEVDGEVVACNLLLWWRQAMVYKANVSRPDWLEVRPNNLLMWRTIVLAQEMGMQVLDMGRTDADHAGLRRFKSLWGACESPLPYFYFPTPERGQGGRRAALGRALRVLAGLSPAWACRCLASWLYRHLA
ncbi:MAG TPA: GNAT family N-acetyltransferase [Dehalococcoidia bacterium]|nr:GNAT family N-acetyltransferase [Dehalococcoidia bacterium]